MKFLYLIHADPTFCGLKSGHIQVQKNIHCENLYLNLLLFRAQHKAQPATDNVQT